MNILVLCTGNSARSILGEAVFNRLGGQDIKAFSAGSKPVGQVNPHALELLNEEGFDTSEFRSKSWDEFTGEGAPRIDIVITVCGNAAGEQCPVWVGAPITVHWGFPDPAAIVGDGDDIRAAFRQVYDGLTHNIKEFLALDPAGLSAKGLRQTLQKIHEKTLSLQ